MTNNTGSSIPAGVLTLYDTAGAATFVGDAQLGGVPTGERRLLPFAQDLRTTVECDSKIETMLAELTVSQGVAHVTTRQREVLLITITGPANEPRFLLVEISKDGDRTLTFDGGPSAGTEETATAWRVPVSTKPGEVKKLTAYVDRLEREQTALLADEATEVVVRLLNEHALTPSARTALQRVAALRQDEATKRSVVDQLKAQQAAIAEEEVRIRQNIAAVGPSDALHSKLTRALEADETKLEQISRALDQATAAAEAAHQTLADAVSVLQI